MKTIIKSICIMVVCLLLTACGSVETESKELTIYYVISHPYYATAMTEFKMEHSLEQMNMVGFDSDEALVTQLATEMAAGKGPDVVLLSGDTSFDIYKAARSGQLLDLKPYMEADEDYEAEDYIETVIKAGKLVMEQQVVMPFSFSLDVLYMTESAYQELDISEDTMKDYKEMTQALMRYAELDEEDKLSQLTPNSLYAEQSYTQRSLLNAKILSFENNNFLCSTEGLESVTSYLKALNTECERKNDLANTKFSNPFDVAKTFTLNGNYIRAYAMYNGMTQYYNKEKCIAIPWKNIDGMIQPFVCDFGFASSQCRNKQIAYELLYFLMNYEVSTATNRPMSVVEQQLIDSLKEVSTKEIKVGKVPYKTAKLSEDEVSRMMQQLQDMAVAEFICTGYIEVLEEQIMSEQKIDAEVLQKDLQRYMDE